MKKIKQTQMKIGYFEIEYDKINRPSHVIFSYDKDLEEFFGRACITDFIAMIKNKQFRGYKIFPLYPESMCIDKLYRWLKRRDYDISVGMMGVTCIFLKFYINKYVNDKGVMTHSNVVTFMTTGL